MKSWLREAREASGLRPENCASALMCSKNTYDSREDNPGTLKIDEIRILYGLFDKEGRRIMWRTLSEFKP